MDSADDPHRMAATLAIDLREGCPWVDDSAAAEAAWHAFSDDEGGGRGAIFRDVNYKRDVMHAMDEIRAERMERVEHKPEMVEKARKLLK